MSFIIADGHGGGNNAGVNDYGRLLTVGINSTLEHNANHFAGKAFNMLFSVTPTGSGDCFLYLKNQSITDIVIEGFHMMTASNEIIQVVLDDTGVPVSGNTSSPSNSNAGSAYVAEGVFQTGNNITGLSGGIIVDKIAFASGSSSSFFNFEQDIIVPRNRTFTLYAVTGGIALMGTLVFNYHDADQE